MSVRCTVTVSSGCRRRDRRRGDAGVSRSRERVEVRGRRRGDAESGTPRPTANHWRALDFAGFACRRLVIVKQWTGLTTQVCVPGFMDAATLRDVGYFGGQENRAGYTHGVNASASNDSSPRLQCRRSPTSDTACCEYRGTDRRISAAAPTKLLPRTGFASEARAGQAAGRQGRLRPDRAGPASRPHRADQQDAPVPGVSVMRSFS